MTINTLNNVLVGKIDKLSIITYERWNGNTRQCPSNLHISTWIGLHGPLSAIVLVVASPCSLLMIDPSLNIQEVVWAHYHVPEMSTKITSLICAKFRLLYSNLSKFHIIFLLCVTIVTKYTTLLFHCGCCTDW